MTARIVLVGARSARQGTGPFISAGLETAGARVSGIVGTSAGTLDEARRNLETQWGISSRGYLSLADAIAGERPDAVALCSPWAVHAEQLREVAAAGCHCLVEKPLVWPGSEADVDTLVTAFEDRSLLLQMVTQWPTTVPAFTRLHGALPEQIEEFTMGLSPISTGPTTVPDSAPHFISMLQALLGEGECEQVRCQRRGESHMALHCDYRHPRGTTRASLLLETREQRPRPAWYAINGLRVDREVELPAYQQYLVSDGRRAQLEDPMQAVAEAFLQRLAAGEKTRGDSLRSAHQNLLQLAAAV